MACPLILQSIVTCKAVKAHSGHLLYYHTSRDSGILRTSQVNSRSYNALYEIILFIFIIIFSPALDRSLFISSFNRQWPPSSSPCWLELRPCDQRRTSHTIPLPFHHCSPVLGAWSRRVLLVFLFSLRIGQVFRLFVDSFVALTSQFLWRLDLIKSKLRAKKTDFY